MPTSPLRTPQERLTNRPWRLLNSWWLLLPMFSCGCLTWVGFLYIGISARRWAWWLWGLVYGAITIAGIVIIPSDTITGPRSDIGSGLLTLAWLAAVVHGLTINRDWLRHRASGPWYAQGWPEQQPPRPPMPSRSYPAGAVNETTSLCNEPPGASTVDANTASAIDLSRFLGLAPSRTTQIVRIRQQRGGFAGLDDFAAATPLAPHELVRVRELLRFSPPAPPAAGPAQSVG
jgi:hypothetical protein